MTAENVTTALELIGTLTSAIKAVVQAVTDGKEGRLTADEVTAQIDSLRGAIATNDGAALDELRKRFP